MTDQYLCCGIVFDAAAGKYGCPNCEGEKVARPLSLLREVGEALYGPRRQSDLARALGVSDRTMRRWIAGEFSIPDGLAAELRALLKARGLALAAVRRKLPR